MSTKALHDLIKWASAQDADMFAFDGTPIAPPLQEAEDALAAIERAAVALSGGDGAPGLGDAYGLMDRIALERQNPEGPDTGKESST